MAFAVKDSDNISVDHINTITEPNSKTLVDRYVFASNFCKGKTVLDCACGHGYGGVILRALGATSVTGIDIDQDALSKATLNYFGFIPFFKRDVTKKWDEKNEYDCVVSVETFEHIKREDVPQMLKNFKSVCRPDGTIFITTPQRQSPTFEYKGGTHLYEYSINEFLEEIQKVFKGKVELYYAVEFRHQFSPELNTVFTKNPEHAQYAPVMVAVIQNVK